MCPNQQVQYTRGFHVVKEMIKKACKKISPRPVENNRNPLFNHKGLKCSKIVRTKSNLICHTFSISLIIMLSLPNIILLLFLLHLQNNGVQLCEPAVCNVEYKLLDLPHLKISL